MADAKITNIEDRCKALLALADRVEALIGSDRDTDLDIDLIARPDEWMGLSSSADLGRPIAWLSEYELPPYTASLDAAMTLVPDGYDWIVGNVNGGMGGTPYACVGSTEHHFGNKPVLALLAGALRAQVTK